MRHPPIGQVWLHIDRLDREDDKVWAIQSRGPRGGHVYHVGRSVVITRGCYTQFYGVNAEQPKAYLVFIDGRVSISDDGTATIS